ncbi:asparagine synthase (glutamine-hydrolyzing) [Pelagibacteraceae bacterium]|nr:asparagine synthase (glutamine-hydrolyzing) [Pelagibacteraceae bacterium]
MCSIFGLLNVDKKNYNLNKLLNCMNHRGPDDSGFFEEHNDTNQILLGQNRLEILDVKNGKQPMIAEDKNTIIVFNGEIYNHQKLRNDLEILGHKFNSSHSDTEVLLLGYKQWGSKLPNQLNGMWAFSIYDKRNNLIFLSRDRFGEKPLYYFQNDKKFIFSSELKFFNNIKNINFDLNILNLKKYCGYGFFPDNLTPYNNIYKVLPGHNIIFDISKKKTKLFKYWEYLATPDYKKTERDWSEEIYFLLNKSVNNRLVADVKVGVFLSGGLDSSIIANLARLNSSTNIETYSIGYDLKQYDESKYSNFVSTKINSLHFSKIIKYKDINNIKNELFDKLDEPLSDSSLISYYSLCKLASKNVKVVLGGDAADEMLAGYNTFKAAESMKYISFLKLNKINPLLNKILSKFKFNHGNMNTKFNLSRFLRFMDSNLALMHPSWISPLSTNYINQIFNCKTSKEEIFSESINLWEREKLNTIDKSIDFYTKIFLPNQILTKTDRLSMMHSLEVRSPFLDYELVNTFQKIPSNLKLKNNISKYILKKTFENLYGKKFTYRKKMGFTTPLSEWFSSQNNITINSKLLKDSQNIINEGLESHKKNTENNRIFLWNIMNLDNFLSKNHY